MRTAVCAVLALAAAIPAAALQHTVVPGDHLWALAGRYYNNHFRWKVIYAANRDKIKDPHWIYPGQVFDIPDVPGPEIGQLPARPVEAEAPAAPPPEEPQAEAAPPPEPAPKRQPPPSPEQNVDDLSTKMPQGMTGMYPSLRRFEAPEGWTKDGAITEFDGREAIAAEGDWVFGRIEGATAGQLYTVLRPGGPQELDEDQQGRYLQVIGVVKAVTSLGDSKWRLLVEKSGDTVQVGDFLKLEGK